MPDITHKNCNIKITRIPLHHPAYKIHNKPNPISKSKFLPPNS